MFQSYQEVSSLSFTDEKTEVVAAKWLAQSHLGD